MALYTKEQIKAAILREIYSMDPESILGADTNREYDRRSGIETLTMVVQLSKSKSIGVREGAPMPSHREEYYCEFEDTIPVDEMSTDNILGKWKI